MKRIIILGCTGSIGRSTLDIIRSEPGYKVAGLTAHTSSKALYALGREFPDAALLLSGDDEKLLLEMIRQTDADIVVNGITGAAGLLPSVAALESGKDLALANKETMVLAGPLVNRIATLNGKRILPVDSEHSALFMLLAGRDPETVEELILTASGGAFRDLPADRLSLVTKEEALKHPNWSMGPKITIDSATMANKGLEVIEACRLFDLPQERIKVLIHPQSYVHSLIRTTDQALYAQLSLPDMKLPIRNALTWPDMRPEPSCRLELAGKALTFTEPDPLKYPMLPLARKAMALGGTGPVVYNAANEVAVDSFIKGHIRFTDIARIVSERLYKCRPSSCDTLEEVLATDGTCRTETLETIRRLS
jgi:1-deoxy-D-xylulose-5-phosphate reductoisomerase